MAKELIVKICRDCSVYKNVSLFNKKSASKDGFEARCKACDKIRRIFKKNNPTSKRKDFNDITGMKFNNWTILRFDKFYKGRAYWVCQCNCKNKTIRSVVGSDVTNNKSKGCGCIRFVKGELHQAWKKGLSDKNRELNKTRITLPEYQNWRNVILKRDSYTCQISGTKKNLCVHHIESWANNVPLRYDLQNGITMSKTLHIKFHALYGRTNNNRNQFMEFANSINKITYKDI